MVTINELWKEYSKERIVLSSIQFILITAITFLLYYSFFISIFFKVYSLAIFISFMCIIISLIEFRIYHRFRTSVRLYLKFNKKVE